MRKNVASQVIGAQMITAADGTAFTGSVTVSVTGDGGTQATGSVGSGACVHEGNGFHSYAPAQTETNYDHIAFTFTGTGAIPVTVQVYPAFPQTGDAFARVGAAGAGLTAVPWNASWDAEVQSEVQDAIEANHLDHLFATTYDPASKPGAADALMNELVESDAGVARFTANALEQAPTGGGTGGLITSGTAAAIADTSITLASGHGISDTTVQIVLTGGTNAVGKDRIATYSGAGDVFNVDPAWNATVAGNAETTPSGTITYTVYPVPAAPTSSPSGVNVIQIDGDAQSLADLKDFADAGYDPSTNKVQGVVLTDTVTTYTGNTPQTGDAFARLGAPAGASVSADIAAIEAQTDDIGTAGAGLTAVPWNAAWDAEVQSEVADALVAYDPPTNAEMEARTIAAANYATAANLATVDGIVDTLASGVITGAAATGTLSTTQATSNLTGYADDQLIGRVIIWLTGACEGEATDITDYANTGGLLTFTALTTAPGNGDTFKIV